MKLLNIISFLLLLLSSCAPIYVNYDYDKVTDFSEYKTYNYFSDIDSGLSELDTNRLLDALDLKLKEKGFILSNTPDFLIDINSTEFIGERRETVGVGVAGGGGNVGGGITIGLPIGQANINRQIKIDFIDEEKKQLFWQAICEFSFNIKSNPEKREVKLNAVVEKVLAQYPPEK